MNIETDRHIAIKILKIVFPVWLTFFLFAGSMFFIFVPALEKNMMKQKKQSIKNLVDSSCSILEQYQRRVKQGKISLNEAHKRAVDSLRHFRYGPDGKDYFWINDMHPFMIMHPYRPDLEGQDLTLFKDQKGNYPFIAMVKTVMDKGSGYVKYSWQWKDAPRKIMPKISYVKGFAPWGWILGTGIYTHDVKREIDAMLQNLSIIFIVILIIILTISIYVTFQTLQIENERTISAEKLKKSETLHRKFIDQAPIGMYTMDLEGRFTYINRKLESISGYKKADWLHKPFHPIVHPEDLHIAQTKISSRLKGEGDTAPYAIRIYKSDRAVIWIKITSETLYGENETPGRITGIQSFVEDITHQKEAQAALKYNEGRLKAILEANPEPMVVYDLMGHPDYLNPAFVDKFGWKLEELRNKKIPFVPEDQQEITAKKIKEIFKHGKALAFETKRYTRDHRCLEIYLSAAVNKDDAGKPIGMVVNLTDITEKKELESKYEQAHKMESIGNLAGGIAHEFNNILSIIIGNNEMVMEEIPSDSLARECTEEIKIAGLRARDVVKQLLTFSRQDNAIKKGMDFKSVVQESLKLIRSSTPANIEIQQILPADIFPVIGNETQINQLLINLCSNAADAIQAAQGLLKIELSNETLDEKTIPQHALLEPGRYVRLTVSDNGIGIENDIIDRIFEPYYTTKKIGKGSGIGLAVVHGIVEDHGGSITVESVPQEGTTFTILLPATDRPTEKKPPKKSELPRGTEKILFVDDEPSIAALGKRRLEILGYDVTSFTNPLDALEYVRSHPEQPDLVISDMAMPKMSGDEMIKEILCIRPDIPTIICTGYSDVISEHEAAEYGITSFLLKPVAQAELAAEIRKILDKKQP